MELKDYKWLIASCLQKSIRRGLSELAYEYVNFLWEYDKNYLVYRLGTILTEDIGIANKSLLTKYLDTKLSKVKIEENGGLIFIQQIVEEACNSNKDRSSCDAAYLAAYYKLDKKNSHDDLKTIFLCNDSKYIDRINCGWIYLGNNKYKNELLDFSLTYPINEKNKQIDDLKRFIELSKNLNLDDNFLTIIENAYLTQIENISLGLPIVENIFNNEKNMILNSKIKTGDIIKNKYIKEEFFYSKKLGLNLLSCGIDGHTKEGKNVYYQYLKQNTEFVRCLKEYKINYQDYFIVLSHCMFRTEGHEVNNRLFFPTAVKIMRDCEQEVLKFKSKTKHLLFSDLNGILKKDISLINQIREQNVLTNDNESNLKIKM